MKASLTPSLHSVSHPFSPSAYCDREGEDSLCVLRKNEELVRVCCFRKDEKSIQMYIIYTFNSGAKINNIFIISL